MFALKPYGTNMHTPTEITMSSKLSSSPIAVGVEALQHSSRDSVWNQAANGQSIFSWDQEPQQSHSIFFRLPFVVLPFAVGRMVIFHGFPEMGQLPD